MTITAIASSFHKNLDTLNRLSDDQLKKGDTGKEAKNVVNKMYEPEILLMLIFWIETLEKFYRASQFPQSENVILQACADLYSILADQLHTSTDQFERFESFAKDVLPNVE